MAIAKLSSNFNELHGKNGNYIHYYVKGYHYVRSYSIPRNPRSMAQQKNRSTFAEAVKSWQELSHEARGIYNRIASNERYSGYNLFISMRMKGIFPDEKIPQRKIQLRGITFHDPYMIQTNSVSIPYPAGNCPLCLNQRFNMLKIPGVPVSPAA